MEITMKPIQVTQSLERWDVFEISCTGTTDGNPFTQAIIQGTFISKNETKVVDGFYNGDGIYIVRFMPSFAEFYRYTITSNFSDELISGTFEATESTGDNHGPVHVANTFHFAYSDGTPYFSIGTTCYVWNLQSDELIEQTLAELKNSAFNKIRFCIFPKHYDYNLTEPRSYPYEGTPMDSSILNKENFLQYNGNPAGNDWDFERFNPEHFNHLDFCVKSLLDMNIQADIIVMHPYDRWGFSLMSEAHDDLYWNYVVARYAAYRNVWWSLANEYDLMPQKSLSDWERYADILVKKDPYVRLRSIHNCRPFYDYTRPWITHCSIQRQDVYKSAELVDKYRDKYCKPVVLDEICYEGNIQHGWGNVSAQELVRRFWEATCRGGYAGHGETYMHEQDILWWSHGGKLHGESPARLAFLKKIFEQIPRCGLIYMPLNWDEVTAVADRTEYSKASRDYYLSYFGFNRPSFRDYHFDEETMYEVKVIDTWNMTIEDAGVHKGAFRVNLPSREYMAIQLTKENK